MLFTRSDYTGRQLFETFNNHHGHELELAQYALHEDGTPDNVGVECLTCNEVLVSVDYTPDEEVQDDAGAQTTVTLRLSREDAEHLSKHLDSFSPDGANRNSHAEIDTRQFRFIRDELFLCIHPEHRATFESVSRIHRTMRAEIGDKQS